jgi:hypothetical protein
MSGFPGTWLQNGSKMAPKAKKTMNKKKRFFFKGRGGDRPSFDLRFEAILEVKIAPKAEKNQ